MYNNLGGTNLTTATNLVLPTVRLTNADGLKMIGELENDNNIVSIDIPWNATNEVVASFSSRGPVATNWMIKPDVCAPGVSIRSTNRGTGYVSMNGTSMASPHVAGAAALILQANPSWGVDEVKAALMNTAQELRMANGTVYPHNTQGAGSIRVADAIITQTLALPGSHSFGVFEPKGGKEVSRQHFTIKNLSSQAVRYTFEADFKGNNDAIKITISNNTLVQSNRSQQVNMNIQVDTSALEKGYYEGKIKVSDGKNVINVPTILFIQEPDFPPVTHAYYAETEDEKVVTVFSPGGADYVQFLLYRDAFTGNRGTLIGAFGGYYNIEAGFNDFVWDGMINDNMIQPGFYHIGASGEISGRTSNATTTRIRITR